MADNGSRAGTPAEEINLADAKARLSELVERAAAGDIIRILRRGKPVAQLAAVPRPKKPIDPQALRGLTDAMRSRLAAMRNPVRWTREDDRF